jgi:hypothetical protein
LAARKERISVKTKRVGPAGAFLIILVGVLILGGAVYYMYMLNRDRPQPFFIERRGTGQRLMAQVEEFDLENNYPGSPEEVIGLYVLLYELIYGRIVESPELLWDLVGMQRQIFGRYLVENNTHQEQFDLIREETEWMFDNAIRIHSVHVGVFFESDVLHMASVPITKTMINNPEGDSTLFFNYFLALEDGRWKIYNWERTDGTFLNPWQG